MGENDTTAVVVNDLTTRINELEVERDGAQHDVNELRAALMEANQLVAELRARMHGIALLIRP